MLDKYKICPYCGNKTAYLVCGYIGEPGGDDVRCYKCKRQWRTDWSNLQKTPAGECRINGTHKYVPDPVFTGSAWCTYCGERQTLQQRIIKELEISMDIKGETDIAFVAMWISRRTDGSLTPTMCHLYGEPLPYDVKKKIPQVLRNLAENIERNW